MNRKVQNYFRFVARSRNLNHSWSMINYWLILGKGQKIKKLQKKILITFLWGSDPEVIKIPFYIFQLFHKGRVKESKQVFCGRYYKWCGQHFEWLKGLKIPIFFGGQTVDYIGEQPEKQEIRKSILSLLAKSWNITPHFASNF